MRLFLVLILAGLLASCSGITNKTDSALAATDDFAYRADFYPAFTASCKISIVKRKQNAEMKLVVYHFPEISDTLEISYEDAETISAADLNYFFSSMGAISLMTMKSNKGMGLDGITVDNAFYQGTSHNSFRFWSPAEGTPELTIAKSVIALAKQKFTSEKQQEYLSSLERYFR